MKNKTQMKQGKLSLTFDTFNVFFLAVLTFVCIYPVYYVFIVSISDGLEVMKGSISLWPKGANIDAFKRIFENKLVLSSYRNTLIYVAVGTATNLIMTIFCAYPLSRSTFYGKKIFTIMIAITMFFNGGLIPTYLLVDGIGLVDSMWALILPASINTFYMIMMRTFFKQIPLELTEAAYIDGANDIAILLRVIIPLSKAIIATMTLFYVVYHWNSWFSALIYLNTKSKFPLQLTLKNILVEGDFDMSTSQSSVLTIVATNYKYAVVVIALLPVLAFYPFVQKYFVKGVIIGAIKG